MRFKTLVSGLVVSLVASASVARAFDEPTQFFDRAPAQPHAATLSASGEGIYFTGAPRFASQTCQDCHVDTPQILRLQLNADDVTLFSSGYQPGHVYALEVQLLGETKGLTHAGPTCTEPLSIGDHYSYVQCNNNAFVFEADSLTGALGGAANFCATAPVGGMCPPPDPHNDESLVAPNGDAVFANRPHSPDPNTPKVVLRNGATNWHFWWTAPPAGTGPVTLYATAVDGNGASGTSADDQDPYGDDTVQASFPLQEAGAAVPTGASAGCSFAPHANRDADEIAVASLRALAAVLVSIAILASITGFLRRRRTAKDRPRVIAT